MRCCLITAACLVGLISPACGGPGSLDDSPGDVGEGEVGGTPEMRAWWVGAYTQITEQQGGFKYAARYTLGDDGSFEFVFENCDRESRSKTGTWVLADEEDGSSVELLNETGDGPFSSSAGVDTGDSQVFLNRQFNGACVVGLGSSSDASVPEGGDLHRGAKCLSDSDCLSSNLDVAAPWCAGEEPDLPPCPEEG